VIVSQADFDDQAKGEARLLKGALAEPLQLTGVVQHYDWGMSPPCKVAEYSGFTGDGFCAELWFGGHAKAPAIVHVCEKDIALSDLIRQFPKEVLGARMYATYGAELPFLFKILSIRTALSIQAHPNKKLAGILHAKDPANYPDANHKPEMALALTELQALAGFRPIHEIVAWIKEIPELAALVSPHLHHGPASHNQAEWLKEAYISVMRAEQDKVRNCSLALFSRLAGQVSRSDECRWISQLQPLFPQGDRGLFAFFFLNLVTLNPGEVMFMGPHYPHAYLSGEIIECMANSDNVVRGGLTKKFIDVPTLESMLDYTPNIWQPRQPFSMSAELQYFKFPVDEFSLTIIGCHHRSMFAQNGARLVFSLGKDATIEVGKCVFTLRCGEPVLLADCAGPFSVAAGDERVVVI
jgi:mannose-6-phosphate isomerase